jgi:predicted RNA-binding protein with PUA-like domain
MAQEPIQYWLIKSEPHKYSWEQFEKDQLTFWDGVRNYLARNNLREMKVGDLCMYYHSNEGKEVVGIAEVVRESYQDPTTEDQNWVVVDVKPVQKLKMPVSLATMKADPRLQGIELIRMSRLSVSKLKKDEFDIILSLSES